ncbi:MAG: hypothetical protein AAGD35_20440, partial [Actinomycetota bacterium]
PDPRSATWEHNVWVGFVTQEILNQPYPDGAFDGVGVVWVSGGGDVRAEVHRQSTEAGVIRSRSRRSMDFAGSFSAHDAPVQAAPLWTFDELPDLCGEMWERSLSAPDVSTSILCVLPSKPVDKVQQSVVYFDSPWDGDSLAESTLFSVDEAIDIREGALVDWTKFRDQVEQEQLTWILKSVHFEHGHWLGPPPYPGDGNGNHLLAVFTVVQCAP